MIGQITTSQVQTEDGVRQSITFINWYIVSDTIARVQNNTSGTTRSVKGQDSLNGNVHSWRVECLEHDLSHFFSVCFGVERSLGQQDWMLFRSNSQLIIFSISSQLVTIPCSIGYLRVNMPLLDWASSPTYESFWPMPTMTPWCLGRPTIDGNTALGASSPAKPALHIPEPLSTTKAATSSYFFYNLTEIYRLINWTHTLSENSSCQNYQPNSLKGNRRLVESFLNSKKITNSNFNY
ncbi:beta [Brachionus plicatilis]|uniref:Beta n=1 Tax=Brachionus plicatilis TaxID=10195 RepID=A0A3M7PMT7_BRAPC|nr:beta [Brachionus plicatilis]